MLPAPNSPADPPQYAADLAAQGVGGSRPQRNLAGWLPVVLGASLLLVTACLGGTPGPAPTPDPFAALSQRAEETFQLGRQQFDRGDYQAALASYQRAKLLSPVGDPKYDDWIARTLAILSPSPTALPTSTPLPPTATPLALAPSTSAPDSAVAARVLGTSYLVIVPGKNVIPPPASTFYREDQVGLFVQNLDQRLRLPLELRVFNLDSQTLVAASQNAGEVPTAITPGPTATQTTSTRAFPLVRFWDNFVWYHQGGEPVGRFRVEVYSAGALLSIFNYSVGNVPVEVPVTDTPTPQPELGTPTPDVAASPVASTEPKPNLAGAAGGGASAAGANGGGAPASAQGATVPTEPPTPTPPPTPTATPQPAITTQIGGLPAGLNVYDPASTVFVADASGIVWTVNESKPTLRRPFTVGGLPVDVAVDQSNGILYLSTRSPSGITVLRGQNGQKISFVPLPVMPGQIALDAELGVLFVVLPEKQSVAVVDIRTGSVRSAIDGLPEVSGLALDTANHVLYVAQLTGRIVAVNARTAQIAQKYTVSGAGIFDIATARGFVFAINAPTRQLIILDPSSGESNTYPVEAEPAGIVASETTGTVYVLTNRPSRVMRFDAITGVNVGAVTLPDRPGQFGLSTGQASFQGLRARMALDQQNETVYVSLPEAGTLSIVPVSLFPPIAGTAAVPPGALAKAGGGAG